MRARYLVARVCAALAIASTGGACSTPAPDPDATSEGAILLAPGRSWIDLLACEKRRNDCLDVYRVPVEGRGRLLVTVDASREAIQARTTTVELYDAKAQRLETSTLDVGDKRLSTDVKEGSYFVVVSSPPGEMMVPYRLQVTFAAAQETPQPPVSTPRPPPPRPNPPQVRPQPPQPPPIRERYQAVSGAILELGGTAGNDQIVLIELGEGQGIRPGMRGRLVESGKVLGELVIEEVFREGSRARIRGELRAPVTPRTRVEVDVPVEVPGVP
jgi:hypothetical protein